MEFNLQIWFDGFWAMYEPKLCKGQAQLKGAKSMAFKAAQKHIKDEETAKKALMALAAQKKYFFECPDHPRFPMVATWLNQERWTTDIDSHAELKERVSGKKCRCGKEATLSMPDGMICMDCHAKHAEPRTWRYAACREAYRKMIIDAPEDIQSAYGRFKMLAERYLAKKRADLDRKGER